MAKSKYNNVTVSVQELRQLAIMIAKASIINIQVGGSSLVQVHIDQASSKVLDMITSVRQHT